MGKEKMKIKFKNSFILNLLFWVVFLALFNFHIHNNSWITSFSLTFLLTINLVYNGVDFIKQKK